MFKKLLIFILFLYTLCSCKWFGNIGSPFYAMTDIKIPDGTPAFQQGFRDGCSTSTYARNNVLFRNRYGYKYDPKMIGNAEYRFGHSRGYTWCFQQSLAGVTSTAGGSWDRYMHPWGYDATFSSGDINSAWGGFFKGNGSLAHSAGGDVGGFMGTLTNSNSSVMSANPLWAGGSSGQIFGQ